MAIRYDEISTPTLLVDPIGRLIYLTNNVFIPLKLKAIIKEVQWLESRAKSTKQGVYESRSRMVISGIHYKYGTLAW